MKLLDGHELQRLYNTEQRTPEKFHFIYTQPDLLLLAANGPATTSGTKTPS